MRRNTKKSQSLTASKLRIVLVGLIALILAAMVAGFILLSRETRGYANEVKTVSESAANSATEVARLQNTSRKLTEYDDAVERAQNIAAETTQYMYQDQVVRDLTEYANRSGLSIQGFTFSDAGGSDAAGGSTPVPAPAATGGITEGGAVQPATPTATALQTQSVSVQLGQSVQYENFLQFIRYIEQNLTKMQVDGLSLGGANSTTDGSGGSSDGNSLGGQTLTIKVYMR
ncbi:hypothetical protein FJZ39_03420 [Candidatus Saccharibacteria bacterium]|nr:hypothetical protein [Candidatus Saccharibacteria bacterium]